jgi:hypothetical protein
MEKFDPSRIATQKCNKNVKFIPNLDPLCLICRQTIANLRIRHINLFVFGPKTQLQKKAF